VRHLKVLLTVPSLNLSEFKGLARVSLELYKGLLKNDVEVEVYEVHKPRKNYIKTLTTVPIKQLFSKADIIHATSPENGIFLKFMKNTVATFHDFIPFTHTEKLKFKKGFIVKNYAKISWWLASKVKVVVVNSTQTAQEFKRYYGREAIVINPGCDERFKPLKVKKDKITLGWFGNWSYRKNLRDAIEVFKLVKKKIDCKLLIAGGSLGGLYQEEYNPLELTRGLEDVEIREYIPESKIVEFYNEFDVYLRTSLYEGFDINLIEAMRCCIPCFVFSWAKIPEETTKFALKCSDTHDMANKILELIDSEDYKKISKKGIEYTKQFTWERFCDQHLQIYESL